MRAATLNTICGFLLVLGSTPAAMAQDEFDDEFGDEFADEPAGDATPATDELGDEFGDDELAADAEPDDEAGPADDEEVRSQRFRSQNTLEGPIGGLRVVDAGSAAVGSFRVQLATDFFFTSDYLNVGDEDDHIGGHLSLSGTVHDMVELYASLASYANSNTMEDPALFQVLGDTLLGIKVFKDVTPFLTLGGDVSVAFLNTVGDIGLVLGSTSFGLRANMTADLRGLASPVPFIARLSLQYYFDNSSNLVEDVENRRFAALPDPAICAPGTTCPDTCEPGMPCAANESRHLLSRVERFALGINRTDFFNFGIGLEAPLRAAEDFYIHPILEWTLHQPVNRQGYDCLFIPSVDDPSVPAAGEDSCLSDADFGAVPMNLTLGVRVLPPIRGFAAFVGVDIGLTGTSNFVRELAPNAPYSVLLGASYAYDTRRPPQPEPVIQEVERRVEVPAAVPPKGRVMGLAVEQGANTPVAGAIVAFPGRDLTSLVTGEDGRFVSYQFDPGEVQLALTHGEYNPGGCAATIAEAGGDVEVRCELVALPRLGTVAGGVTGEDGAAVSTQVQLSGAMSRSVSADSSGRFRADDLTPGSYTARVDAEGYLIKLEQFEVRPREVTNLQIQLVPRPRNPTVRVRARDIQIRRQINFATDSAEILESSFGLMTEIADVLMRNPELHVVEIQGHTDNVGGAQHNQELSQRRAESVRTWLVTHGVESERLTSTGYGMTRPLVPNITPANRARNRRVQFIIQERE